MKVSGSCCNRRRRRCRCIVLVANSLPGVFVSRGVPTFEGRGEEGKTDGWMNGRRGVEKQWPTGPFPPSPLRLQTAPKNRLPHPQPSNRLARRNRRRGGPCVTCSGRARRKEGRKEGRGRMSRGDWGREGGREGAREAECFMVSDEASQPASSELLPILSLPAPVASIRPSRPSVSQSTLSLIFPN